MSTFAIGDEVTIPQGHKAILRWIGRIPGKGPSEYAGVEVIGPESQMLGKHSGTFHGKNYFQTSQPGTGLFISYTQLVSANVKTPRFPPPHSNGNASNTSLSGIRPTPPSPIPHTTDFGSPNRSMSPGFRQYDFSQQQQQVQQLQQQVQQLNNQIETLQALIQKERTQKDTQRNEYRMIIEGINGKVSGMTAEYESRLKDLTNSYEQKLKQARRSSLVTSPDSELDEQRLALASMQNKLISERQEKQREIEDLRREVASLQKAAGSAEDLESLAKELSKYEEALRSQSQETTSSKQEVSRLEQALEAKILRESELEEQNEKLKAEVEELKHQLQSANVDAAAARTADTTPESVMHTEVKNSPPGASAATSVPVPNSLSQFEDDTSNIDLAAGRTDWCALCEREGHQAIECPYE